MARKTILHDGDAVESWRGTTYVKVEESGRGGSAEVCIALATDGPRRGVLFALKMFTAGDREGWLGNFMREIHVLRDCDHPSVVKVFDEGVHVVKDPKGDVHEHPFFVMEYLPDTLHAAMADGRLTERDKLGVAMQLTSALNYLSRRDPPIVHRDVKPKNIFLKARSCILGDFGLIFQESNRARTAFGGSKSAKIPEMAQEYRTPELVAFRENPSAPAPTPASDVFQLGLVLAKLFTGGNPLSPGRPFRLGPVPPVKAPSGPFVNSLLQGMLTLETDSRPTAADMLGLWQDLFLRSYRRERDSDPKESIPTIDAPPLPASRTPPDRARRTFGEGLEED